MLRPRIIPCLLVDNNRLVKTVNFKDPKYVGDPLNAVKIFNEKSVDELMFVDISASRENKEPNYDLIEKVATECRMPLCYGGGIKTVEQAKKVLGLGVEKISLSSKALEDPSLLQKLADEIGSQSVVVTLDVKKKRMGSGYHIYTMNGKHKTKYKLDDYIRLCQDNGVGELVINSIDKDGLMEGYDIELITHVKQRVSIPLTVLGGAGSLEDFRQLYQNYGLIGMAVGSYFVFKGKFRAVLISYPSTEDKRSILGITEGSKGRL
jgi:cyclase